MFNSISEEQFLQKVDTGDILLFRCNNRRIFGSWVTRAFTNSHFDHVALILRFGESVQDLYILEAVGDKGVRITSWINIRSELRVGGFFDKIITRKLCYEMTNERLNDLDQFRRNSVGHRYGLSAKKILFNQRSEPNLHDAGPSEIEKDRQFFCSELIAKAFKVLGVIKKPEIRGSASYFPGSFTTGGIVDQDLSDDVSMGPMLNILVNSQQTYGKEFNLQNIRPKLPENEFDCWI